MTNLPVPATVLVCCRDEDLRNVVDATLRREGHRVVADWMTEDCPELDLIVVREGEEASNLQVLTRQPDVPVLLLREGRDEAMAVGALNASDFVPLPIRPEELARRTAMQLELRSLQRALRERENMLRMAHERLAASESSLRSNALVDPLLGLWNLAAFEARLTEEVARTLRHQSSFALAVLDLDRFTEFNLAYGAAAGDTVFQAVGDVVRRVTRGSDFVARCGDDEIAVLVPDGDKSQAMRMAERLRIAVYDSDILHRPNVPWERMTISVGVAICSMECAGGAGEVRCCAERATMLAKKSGRNKSVNAQCAFICTQANQVPLTMLAT
jgi:diguanylate cyclase (GGDEF)-like protein